MIKIGSKYITMTSVEVKRLHIEDSYFVLYLDVYFNVVIWMTK